MGTIKYTSKTKRIWEFDGEDWYCNGIEVPYATFYEERGDKEILKRIKSKKDTRKSLLLKGDNIESVLLKTGYIYFPIIRDNGKKIVRTKTLTRITED